MSCRSDTGSGDDDGVEDSRLCNDSFKASTNFMVWLELRDYSAHDNSCVLVLDLIIIKLQSAHMITFLGDLLSTNRLSNIRGNV